MAINLTDADVLDDDQLPPLPAGTDFEFIVFGRTPDRVFVADPQGVAALFAPADIFESTAPVNSTPGKETQRYWHLREVRDGAPTRADLYVYNGTSWDQKVTGFVLDATDANPAPLVGLDLSSQSLVLGDSVTLTATPTSAKSSIVSVQFYEDGQPIGALITAAPWQLNWEPTKLGRRTYATVATDSLGKTGTSANKPLVVSPASNLLPNVTLTASPTNLALGQSTQLDATANDTDGSVALLEIFTDASLATRLANGTTGTLSFAWTPTSAGTKLPVARATDNVGGVKVSTAAQVVVNAPPVQNVTAYVGTFESSNVPASIVQAQTAQQWDKAARTLEIPTNSNRPGFAEPQNQGIRSLTDKSGFPLSEGNDYTRTPIALTISGQQVPYWLYLHVYAQDPPSFTFNLLAL